MKTITTFINEELGAKEYKEQYNELLDLAKAKSSAKQIKGGFSTFCPYLQFIRFDALDTKDYPNNIDDNSIFVEFKIDFNTKKVEYFRGGHIYLSKKDREGDYKYYAMRGMADIAAKDYGVKKFRKSSFKSNEDLFNKMETYYKNVMKAVEEYTDGYPYKNGKQD